MSQSEKMLLRELEELEVSVDLAFSSLEEYFTRSTKLLGEIADAVMQSPAADLQSRIASILGPQQIQEQTRLMLEVFAFVNQHSETTRKTLRDFQSQIQNLRGEIDGLSNSGESWKAQ